MQIRKQQKRKKKLKIIKVLYMDLMQNTLRYIVTTPFTVLAYSSVSIDMKNRHLHSLHCRFFVLFSLLGSRQTDHLRPIWCRFYHTFIGNFLFWNQMPFFPLNFVKFALEYVARNKMFLFKHELRIISCTY